MGACVIIHACVCVHACARLCLCIVVFVGVVAAPVAGDCLKTLQTVGNARTKSLSQLTETCWCTFIPANKTPIVDCFMWFVCRKVESEI